MCRIYKTTTHLNSCHGEINTKFHNIEEFNFVIEHLNDVKVAIIKTPGEVTDEEEKNRILDKYHCDELYGANSSHKKMHEKIFQNF